MGLRTPARKASSKVVACDSDEVQGDETRDTKGCIELRNRQKLEAVDDNLVSRGTSADDKHQQDFTMVEQYNNILETSLSK